MSCTGQSAAAHNTSTPSTNHSICRRVTTGEPSRTAFGPITFTAYTAKPMIEATNTHTSGCGWNCHAFMSMAEDVEGEQHDHVHGRGEDDARQEHPAEQLVVEPQVHEERRDHPELHDHHRDQRDEQRDEVRLEEVEVVRRHLGGGDQRQDRRDEDVLRVTGMRVPFDLGVVLGDCHGIRYTTVKIRIHTTSTKCQYKPTISTTSERSLGSRPRSDIMNNDISMTMPRLTCTPWKPVSV